MNRNTPSKKINFHNIAYLTTLQLKIITKLIRTTQNEGEWERQKKITYHTMSGSIEPQRKQLQKVNKTGNQKSSPLAKM